MNFVSIAFGLLFVGVLLLRVIVGRRGVEKTYLLGLLGASLFFYSWHIPIYLSLILVSSIIDYRVGLLLPEFSTGSPTRLRLLVFSLVGNLGILFFFKYADFFLSIVSTYLLWCGLDIITPPSLGLILPIGISFYTFQSMSYSIDVYRGRMKPIHSFWRFFLFVSFFPQLVAGPIVRAQEFLRQLDRPRLLRWKVTRTGLYFLIQGFFLKLVVADNIGPFLDKYWATQSHALATLLLTFLFSCQIFADFAGYSLIARGVAYLLGFRLPVNFNNPYLSMTFQEFWTRWHITLSQWLRDYLYIPMGGNRGSELKTYRNLFLVMLIGGLWHGAALHFIVWGGIHGAALVAEKALRKTNPRRFTGPVSQWCWFAVVQGTVLIAWLFFRSDSPQQAFWFLSNLLVWYAPDENVREMCCALVFTLPVIGWHLRSFLTESGRLRDVSETEKAFWGGIMFCLTLTCYGERTGFIYFQF